MTLTINKISTMQAIRSCNLPIELLDQYSYFYVNSTGNVTASPRSNNYVTEYKCYNTDSNLIGANYLYNEAHNVNVADLLKTLSFGRSFYAIVDNGTLLRFTPIDNTIVCERITGEDQIVLSMNEYDFTIDCPLPITQWRRIVMSIYNDIILV
jgi:hypothetical protein